MGQNYGPTPRTGESFIGSAPGCTLAIDCFDHISGSSTTSDAIGTNTGSLGSHVVYTDDGGNKYFAMDGSQNSIAIDSITLGNGSYTIAIWARADSLSGTEHGRLFSNSSGGPVASSYGFCTNGITMTNYDGAWQTHYGGTSLSTGVWYHGVWANGTGGSNTQIMYLNGAADITQFASDTTNGGPCNVIGARWNAGFNGDIASFQYFHGTTLTATQISTMYNEQKGRFGL